MAETHSIPSGPLFQDLTGRCFGRLTVLEYAGKQATNSRWLCQCDCGKQATVEGGHLKSGRTKSCGCWQKEVTGRRSRSHGKCDIPEYKVWAAMIHRCTSPSNPAYGHYGGRGITISSCWRKSFAAFLADMGSRPTPEHTLERIDNDGNYEKSNCRWATRTEQARNTRRNRLLSFAGETKPLAEWADSLGILDGALRYRIKAGWSVERALTQPVRSHKASS